MTPPRRASALAAGETRVVDSSTLSDVLAAQQRLALALEVSGIGLWDWNVVKGEVHWSDELFRMGGYEVGEVVPSFAAWIDRVHPEDRAGAVAALNSARDLRIPFHCQVRTLHPNGTVRWLLGRGRLFYAGSGRAERMIGTLIDVSDKQAAVERQRTLVAELQRRVRNILSVVRYVFTRTIENSLDLEQAVLHFTGRIDALARTQVIATDTEQGRVDLEGMIRDELLSVGAGDGETVSLSGPDVALDQPTAETLGLVLHELTMNSIKFGALKSQGKLEIHWNLNSVKTLSLRWLETKVPIVSVVGRRSGFGKELIDKALPYKLGATTRFEIHPGGIVCELSIPLGGPPEFGEHSYDEGG